MPLSTTPARRVRLHGPGELLTAGHATATASQVELHDVSRAYGTVRALDSVSLTVPPGVTVLLGRNGAGKSTLARVIAGVEAPDTGELLRGSVAVADRGSRRRHHRDTGWLPQAFNAPGGMSVRHYVGYAAWLKGLGSAELTAAVSSALGRTGLTDQSRRRLRQLSGGMLRRAGIAQAIVHDPGFLVLDEPTVGLDPEQRNAFHGIVGGLADRCAVLLSTHLLEDADALGEQVIVLDRGRVRFDGPMDALRARGRSLGPDNVLRRGFLDVVGEDHLGSGPQ
ncbi:MAG: ABC transporter ATP-binding protein [Nocardioides sp.]